MFFLLYLQYYNWLDPTTVILSIQHWKLDEKVGPLDGRKIKKLITTEKRSKSLFLRSAWLSPETFWLARASSTTRSSRPRPTRCGTTWATKSDQVSISTFISVCDSSKKLDHFKWNIMPLKWSSFFNSLNMKFTKKLYYSLWRRILQWT